MATLGKFGEGFVQAHNVNRFGYRDFVGNIQAYFLLPAVPLCRAAGGGMINENSPHRQCEVVNLRFFAGLTDAEIAPLLGVSDKTVRRDWAVARIWLYDQMRD